MTSPTCENKTLPDLCPTCHLVVEVGLDELPPKELDTVLTETASLVREMMEQAVRDAPTTTPVQRLARQIVQESSGILLELIDIRPNVEYYKGNFFPLVPEIRSQNG